jgi:hypothetical protein
MAIYIRRVGEVADGSVTANKIANGAVGANQLADSAVDLSTAKVIGQIPSTKIADGAVASGKLADNSVDLSTVKVTGELPSSKIADSSIIESKLANLAVSTGKLADSAVSLAKAQQAMKIHHFVGDESEESVTGVTETAAKILSMPRSTSITSGIQPSKLHINAEMKVTGTATGTLKAYIDAEGTPRITLNTTSNTYEMVEGNADISDLANGKHTVTIKMATDDAGETVYNDLIEIFLEK